MSEVQMLVPEVELVEWRPPVWPYVATAAAAVTIGFLSALVWMGR